MDEVFIEDAEQAIRSDASSLNYVLNKDIKEPWAYNNRAHELGIFSRMKLFYEHSGCSIALCLRAAENRIKATNIGKGLSIPCEN
jgi:hypothetical protein